MKSCAGTPENSSKFRTRSFNLWFASPHLFDRDGGLTLQRALFCCGQYHEVKTRTSVIVRVIKIFGFVTRHVTVLFFFFDKVE